MTTIAPSTREYRVGVIGCGMRAISFFKNMPKAFTGRVRLGAVYDPNPEYAAHYLNSCGMGGNIPFVGSEEEVLGCDGLDALIIGSPNDTHVALAKRAFSLKLPILLEKPVAISVEECRELWEAWQAAGQPPVRVGFVLRDTPLYRVLRETLEKGIIGQLLSVDSDELVGDMTTGFFWKSWRLDPTRSGGFLVEKCCHDFDLLRSLSGGEAVRIYATSRKTHLHPETPGALREPRLDEALRKHRRMDGHAVNGSESFYDIPSPTHDHYAVTIEWDNGVLSQFTCCLAQARHARRFRLYGSNGGLTGDMHDNRLILDKPRADHSGPDSCEIPLPPAEGNHHGGDRSINETFWGMVAGEHSNPGNSIRDGIEASLIALAAHQSIASRAPVDIAALRQQVFGSSSPLL